MKHQYIAIAMFALLIACTPGTPAAAPAEPAEPLGTMTEKEPLPDSTMEKTTSAEDSASMQKDEPMQDKMTQPVVTENNDTMTRTGSLMVQDTETMHKPGEAGSRMAEPKPIGGDISKYYLWDSSLFEKSVEEGKLVYLEFSAEWCPVCQKQEPELIAGFEQLDNPNVIGFKIPYKDSMTTDEHNALARKYGIAYQHTKIVLRDGQVVLKNPEAWDAVRFVTEVNSLG